MHRMAALAALLIVVAGCSNEADRPNQTWSKDYDKTTCAEWTKSMTKTEKDAATYDLVADYLRRTESDRKPSKDQTKDFRAAISNGCKKPNRTIVEVAGQIGYQ